MKIDSTHVLQACLYHLHIINNAHVQICTYSGICSLVECTNLSKLIMTPLCIRRVRADFIIVPPFDARSIRRAYIYIDIQFVHIRAHIWYPNSGLFQNPSPVENFGLRPIFKTGSKSKCRTT